MKERVEQRAKTILVLLPQCQINDMLLQFQLLACSINYLKLNGIAILAPNQWRVS
jgi:hypothetical protein